MNPITQDEEKDSDGVDLGAIAIVGMLIGAILALAGLFQQHLCSARWSKLTS